MIQFGDARLPERFWSKVSPEPMSGCWLWIGATKGAGYGAFRVGDVTRRPHQLVFEILFGHLENGMEIDHRCRTRLCCNPYHLESVSHRENSRRMARLITHCPAGHKYTASNTRVYVGYRAHDSYERRCLTCKRAREALGRARRAT